MKLQCLLLFFLYFYFTECTSKIVNYRDQGVGRRQANRTSYIRRGKNYANMLNKQLRRNFDNCTEERKQTIFGDVIKNITRVNNVLEELIKNYERLQQIYKTKETFEGDKSTDEFSDIEVDNMYKQRITRTKEPNNEIVTREPIGITQTSFDEIEKIQVAPKVDNVDRKDNMLQEKRAPVIQFLRKVPKNNVKSVVTNDPLTIDNDNILSETDSESDNSGTNDNKLQEMPKKPKQKTFTIEFNLPRLETFSSLKNSNPVRETIIKAEEYAPDFWDKLAVKAPIHLRTEKVITYRKGSFGNNNNAVGVPFTELENDQTRAGKVPTKFKSIDVNMESENGPVKTTNHVFRAQSKEVKLLTDSREWSAENDKTIEKEQFKTSILRKAYGDACLKVVVEKCYKACKQVTKASCVKYDCKPDFINAFNDHSTKRCTTEFNDETVVHKKSSVKPGDKDDDNDFVDITRSGYLAAACLPSKNRYKPTPIAELTTISPQRNQLHVLREKFEMACQKASAEKCKRACYYATSQACSTYDCKVSLKSNFARECRAYCTEAYRYIGDDENDLDTDVYTGRHMDDSSSISENVYNDSRPDLDFEAYINSTTSFYHLSNKKKAMRSGIDTVTITTTNSESVNSFLYR